MPETTGESSLSHEDINNGNYTLRGIWTCKNPNLAGSEEHVMSTAEADTFEEFANKFTTHFHGNCTDCEVSYDKAYEGELDRVEILDSGENVAEKVSPDTLIQDYGMNEY